MQNVKPLDAAQLYRHTDPDQFEFQTTDDLTDLGETIGQPRAVEAVRFGTGIDQAGYNIYAMGPEGVGKRSLVQKHFEQRAANEPVPPDWVYIYNFEQPHKPIAFWLPPGKGAELNQDMEKFVEELRTTLLAAFESDEYRARRHSIEEESQEEQEKALEALQKRAQESKFALIRTPAGLVFAPVKEGEVISPEEFQNMPEEERKQMETSLEGLQEELQKILQQVPGIQRKIREKLVELNREVTNYSVGGLINELKEKYAQFPDVVKHLDAIREDVVENANNFLSQEGQGQGEDEKSGGLAALFSARNQMQRQASLQRYQVNLFIDHRNDSGAPVIYEDNPTYQNLIGRVEHVAQLGALVTDFSLIKPGSLHKANGGYLILDVRKVLTQPYAWDALKRALESQQIQIESIGQFLSLISTVSLEPQPIPLHVKVALVGDRTLYYLLSQYDPDFNELFKVQADFEEQMHRDTGNQQEYARLIATLVHKNKLRPFGRGAVARVMEHSSRMIEDSERLSTDVRDIANLLREASYWSKENGDGVVTAADVQKAIDAQIYRADRLRERVQETILRGTFLIDTEGARVGQVNGLSVIQLGGFSFGRPSRITATVRLGKGDVVDIEREVDLSGPIHSKGVLILSGFLGSRYAREKPLSLSASLVFEQSYSGVDGDSASSAELYALLSAISEVPIKQNFAVTGAINQHGQVQAIGGVNEKIEGFFDICNSRGLTGDQGVLIPSTNIKHLMLRQDVIDAVAAGKFHIYPVDNIDQGISLLTGVEAGEPDEEGAYPPESVNGRVQARLQELAEKRKELAVSSDSNKEVVHE
jgi:lon-related putative ATP-dependent protease